MSIFPVLVAVTFSQATASQVENILDHLPNVQTTPTFPSGTFLRRVVCVTINDGSAANAAVNALEAGRVIRAALGDIVADVTAFIGHPVTPAYRKSSLGYLQAQLSKATSSGATGTKLVAV